nr:DUF4157 domain-containing protein [Crinalium epipsammum]
MGQAMGADFSCVRVHTDAQSEELNQELMAKAFTTGQEVFFRQGEYNPGSRGGQELLAHELTHVVQQNGGAVQRASKSPGKATTKREITSCGIQVQRVVGNYAIGSTLATTTKAKRGLTKPQMDEVQKLHDDPSNHYTVDQAQSLAIGSNTQSNPYAWEVEGLGSYVTQNPLVQSILENFGHPITDVVKIYTDLGSRVGWEVKHGGLGALTVSDLHQHFDATMPLHVGFNSFLTDEWNGNSNGYAGKQTGIKLYDVMRSKITKDWQAEDVGNYQNLNDLLKGVSGRPPELHHLLNKSVYQANATNVMNLMIAERSASEHNDGPGQHELMHRVSSGNDQNKFKVLLNEVEEEYNNWLVKKTGNQQVRMTPG